MQDDQRSGVYVVRSKDHGHKIVALWVSCFQTRPKSEQLRELEGHYQDWTAQQKATLLERESRGKARVERTPCGVPVVVPKLWPSVFSRKRLQKFQDDMQLSCEPIPRHLVENLSQTEFDRPWLQLTVQQRLALLDTVASLYNLHC
jgi:hypothetical protein